ncbi:hypothetical protein BDR05DRAFT_969370 [Suillus weaverae]|nr:hypothetical protein BDR05DRAFT_969370 [Suillus weaverae]
MIGVSTISPYRWRVWIFSPAGALATTWYAIICRPPEAGYSALRVGSGHFQGPQTQDIAFHAFVQYCTIYWADILLVSWLAQARSRPVACP